MAPGRLVLIALLLAASAATAQPREPTPPPVPPPAPVAPAAPLAAGGFPGLAPGRGLNGLPPVSDAGPLCRARCSQARYACGEEEHCTERWRQCVATCSGASTP